MMIMNDLKKKEEEIIDVEPEEPKAIETEKDTWVPTPKQRYSMELYLDWTKKLTLKDIALKTGVKRMTLYRWRRNPNYINYLQKLSNKMLQEAIPIAEKALVREVNKGDVQAIKLFFEYVGRFREEMDIHFSWGDDKK